MRAIRSLGSLLLLAVLPAFQGGDRPDRPDRPDRDPPSRVGRLSYLSGPVSFRPGDVDDWTDATINYPLHNGDHLWTDSDARAEITVGSSAFRLAPQSAFGFLALDDRTVQVRLSQGSLNVRVRNLGENESLEIDTPSGAVALLRSGVYRVDVDSSGDTTSVRAARCGGGDRLRFGIPGAPGADRDGRGWGFPDLRRAGRDPLGRLGRLVRQPRPPLGRRALVALRVARRDRLRGPGRQRRVAYDAGLRSGVGATHRGHGLGAVPLRPLGLGGAVGLDVDRRRAPRLHPGPVAVAVRRPARGHGAWHPHRTVVRRRTPLAVVVQVLVADHVARHVARRARAVPAAVAAGAPVFPVVRADRVPHVVGRGIPTHDHRGLLRVHRECR